METKETRNARVQARYDELMAEGKHGHYETLFRVVREEVSRAWADAQKMYSSDEIPQPDSEAPCSEGVNPSPVSLPKDSD